jgi:RNA polymerase sigma-70 factor (ECF subfamily)
MAKETPPFLDVEDVVLEAMVRLFNSIKTFRFESSITTFLFKLARRARSELIRKHPSTRGISTFSEMKVRDDEDDVIERIETGNTPENTVIGNDFKVKINAALAELSPILRDVIICILIHGLSYKDTAKVLGILENTVKSRFSRAKIDLKKYFEKDID